MIDARTQLVGLIGWPVEHSLSPVMHNAAFVATNLNWCYVPLPVRPGRVAEAVRGLAALGFRGANVTLPHKEAVQSALDCMAGEVRTLGAVNTLVFCQGDEGSVTVEGHNTDVEGFLQALRQAAGERLQARRAAVVGAGGAARAVLCGLLRAGVQETVLLNRSFDRAQAVVDDLGVGSRLHAVQLSTDALVQSVRGADLLVNATPVGMWPHVDASVWPDDVGIPEDVAVFDLVYRPLETRLLQQASASGARTIDGLGMLVAQGALSFHLWTGLEPPLAVMREACVKALKG